MSSFGFKKILSHYKIEDTSRPGVTRARQATIHECSTNTQRYDNSDMPVPLVEYPTSSSEIKSNRSKSPQRVLGRSMSKCSSEYSSVWQLSSTDLQPNDSSSNSAIMATSRQQSPSKAKRPVRVDELEVKSSRSYQFLLGRSVSKCNQRIDRPRQRSASFQQRRATQSVVRFNARKQPESTQDAGLELRRSRSHQFELGSLRSRVSKENNRNNTRDIRQGVSGSYRVATAGESPRSTGLELNRSKSNQLMLDRRMPRSNVEDSHQGLDRSYRDAIAGEVEVNRCRSCQLERSGNRFGASQEIIRNSQISVNAQQYDYSSSSPVGRKVHQFVLGRNRQSYDMADPGLAARSRLQSDERLVTPAHGAGNWCRPQRTPRTTRPVAGASGMCPMCRQQQIAPGSPPNCLCDDCNARIQQAVEAFMSQANEVQRSDGLNDCRSTTQSQSHKQAQAQLQLGLQPQSQPQGLPPNISVMWLQDYDKFGNSGGSFESCATRSLVDQLTMLSQSQSSSNYSKSLCGGQCRQCSNGCVSFQNMAGRDSPKAGNKSPCPPPSGMNRMFAAYQDAATSSRGNYRCAQLTDDSHDESISYCNCSSDESSIRSGECDPSISSNKQKIVELIIEALQLFLEHQRVESEKKNEKDQNGDKKRKGSSQSEAKANGKGKGKKKSSDKGSDEEPVRRTSKGKNKAKCSGSGKSGGKDKKGQETDKGMGKEKGKGKGRVAGKERGQRNSRRDCSEEESEEDVNENERCRDNGRSTGRDKGKDECICREKRKAKGRENNNERCKNKGGNSGAYKDKFENGFNNDTKRKADKEHGRDNRKESSAACPPKDSSNIKPRTKCGNGAGNQSPRSMNQSTFPSCSSCIPCRTCQNSQYKSRQQNGGCFKCGANGNRWQSGHRSRGAGGSSIGAGDASNRQTGSRPWGNGWRYNMLHPIAHFRPGTMQQQASYVLRPNGMCTRRSLVRTAAGATLHERPRFTTTTKDDEGGNCGYGAGIGARKCYNCTKK